MVTRRPFLLVLPEQFATVLRVRNECRAAARPAARAAATSQTGVAASEHGVGTLQQARICFRGQGDVGHAPLDGLSPQLLVRAPGPEVEQELPI